MTGGIQLIIQYCEDRRRQDEYDACLARNLDNPWIGAVHNLVEPGVRVPAALARHPKYVERRVPDWLSFAAAFAYAGESLPGALVCLCNLDIFLDPDSRWDQADDMVGDGRVVLCLSRHEFDGASSRPDPALAGVAFCHSQDAWLFRPPLAVPGCDFAIGTLGCDNAIADRFDRAGLIPVNAGLRFRVHHYDTRRGKSAANSLSVHAGEAARPAAHPEETGYLLLPDLDLAPRFLDMVTAPSADPLERYRQTCRALSRHFAIRNR